MQDMRQEPEGEMSQEHNPDNLSKEQYGAPEWRLLRVGETPNIGDEITVTQDGTEWGPVERLYEGPINEAFLCAYRRRVATAPTAAKQPADQSARIAELEQGLSMRPEPIVAACNDTAHLAEATYENLENERRYIAELERRVEESRAEVERLTKERDNVRAEVESKCKVTAIALEELERIVKERDRLSAQLAEREEDRWQPINDEARNATEIFGYHPEWVHDEFSPDGIRSCIFDGEVWHSSTWRDDESDVLHHHTGEEPTLWQPLPQPPAIRAVRAQPEETP